jgi:SH3 domain-containing YSC84-like protein 1
VLMSNKAVKGLFKSKFDLGTRPEIALGPVGLSRGLNLRDVLNKKDIYVYTSLKGLFAGFSWKGTVVQTDADANKVLYNRPVSHGTILFNRGIKPPKAALSFSKNMDKIAPKPKKPKS